MNPNSTGDLMPAQNLNQENGAQIDGNKPQTTQPSASRNPTYSNGYTIIPPNESKRGKLQRVAKKELEDYTRWREEHRPGPINLRPETLGGTALSLEEVRRRQQMQAHQSKLQKKIKKEEMDKRRRQEEEEKNQKMKAIQREKANQLEMKQTQEQERRRQLYQHDLEMRREEHLQRLQRPSSVPMPTSSTTPASSWARGHAYRDAKKGEEQVALQQKKDEQRRKSEILEEKQKQEEEDRKRRMETERLRVNSAFLDKLEARGSGRASQLHPCTQEDGNFWQREEPQDPASSPVPFPSQLHTDSAEEEDEEEGADFEWVVMKLQSDFPYYERKILEDIVSQCNSNYQQAYDLLNV